MGFQRFLPAIVLMGLLVIGSGAVAATVVDVNGTVQLGGAAVSGAETPLPADGRLEVVGDGSRATVVAGNGDRIALQPGSEFYLRSVEEGREVYELKSGAFIGRLSPGTVVLLPNGTQIIVPEGTCELSVETREGGTKTAVDVNEGRVEVKSGDQFTTAVTSRQAAVITFRSEAPRKLGVETAPDNEGDVVVLDQATPDLEIEVRVPQASRATMTAVENNTKTKIENSLDSSKEGKLGVVSRVKGEEKAKGEVAPGVFAYVVHDSGAIEFEYVEVDFAILRRAIGLTSEFSTLAVSNYTGVKDPNPRAPKSNSRQEKPDDEEPDDEGPYENGGTADLPE